MEATEREVKTPRIAMATIMSTREKALIHLELDLASAGLQGPG